MADCDLPLYQIEELRYQRDGQKKFILDIPRLQLPRDQIIAIVGASGSGKSTLLNLLTGLDFPDSGEILFAHDAAGAAVPINDESVGERFFGRIFQQGHLLQSGTVSANLALALEADGASIDSATLAKELARVSLEPDMLDRRVFQLSGGQQQRVAAARSMLGTRHVIAADEPTSSLDPDIAKALMECFRTWQQSGYAPARTVLWVTHNYHDVIDFADSVLVLDARREGADTIAGIIENETAPRPVPETFEELFDWVRPIESPPVPAPTDEGLTQGWSTLARSIALGFVFAESRRDNDTEKLRGWLSLPSKSPQVRFRSRLPALWRSFSERNLVGRLTVSMVLCLMLVIGYVMQRDQISNVLADPSVCQVRIAGYAHKEETLDARNLLALLQNPWSAGATPVVEDFGRPSNNEDLLRALEKIAPATRCDQAVGAWPRRDHKFRIWRKEPGEKCGSRPPADRRMSDANTIAFHPHEPVLTRMRFADEERTLSDMFGALRKGQNAIVVSSIFAHDILPPTQPGQARVPAEVCVGAPMKKAEPVKVLGISGELPKESRYYFDAAMPLGGFEAMTGYSNNDEYTTAALYFDPYEADLVARYLGAGLQPDEVPERQYIFDPDALESLTRSISASLTLKRLFGAVTALALFTVLLTAIAAVSALIATNRRALAMQLAIGLEDSFVRRVLMIHGGIVWLFATGLALALTVLALLVNWQVSFLPTIPDMLLIGAYFLSVAFIFLVIIFATTWIVFQRWANRSRGRLSDILQSGS